MSIEGGKGPEDFERGGEIHGSGGGSFASDSCYELAAMFDSLSPGFYKALLTELGGNVGELCRVLHEELSDDQGSAAEHLLAERIQAVRQLVKGFLDQRQRQQ